MLSEQAPVEAHNGEYFDSYAQQYSDILNANLSIAGETGEAFVRFRMEYMLQRLSLLPSKVLDFGCGIGLAVPHLLTAFPGSTVVGVDVSPESVSIARDRCRHEGARFCLTSELEEDGFDLAYASGVFHHIPREERNPALREIYGALRPGGLMVLAEHNPLNPATRYLVRTCPFDEDADLFTLGRGCRMLADAGFHIVAKDYVSFFAGPLRGLRPLERYLRWLPLGAQYIVLGRRPH